MAYSCRGVCQRYSIRPVKPMTQYYRNSHAKIKENSGHARLTQYDIKNNICLCRTCNEKFDRKIFVGRCPCCKEPMAYNIRSLKFKEKAIKIVRY